MKLKNKSDYKILPLEKRNYQVLLIGLIGIICGYIALAQEPWDGFLPLTVAPILLILSYCVVIPFGILWRRKDAK